MNISALILRVFGWRVDITTPEYDKSIICVAPHTSNWDFVLGKLAYWSIGRKAGFLMKASWFFFPMGLIFKSLGGIPVHRTIKNKSLVEQLVEQYNNSPQLTIAITPEGTRKRISEWHTGFLVIAGMLSIPIQLGVLDYETKTIIINKVYYATDNLQADLKNIKDYYRPYKGKYPENFSVDE